jgi:UDP-2,3-diacylglucosamine hydrolase
MGKVYFIADAHLGVESPEKEAKKVEKLLLFLTEIEPKASHLCIVGDLFDFWFEYRTVIVKDFYPVIMKLYQMARSGVEILYICGNHDWWQRDFLRDSIGIKVFQGEIGIVLNNKRIFLAHGDGLSSRNLGDRVFNRILRNRLNVSLFSVLHPDVGVNLGRWLSRFSRRNNKRVRGEVLLDFARERFAEGFDYVVLAHSHSPTLHREGEKVYLNVGDWMRNFTYAEMDSAGVRLHQFNR